MLAPGIHLVHKPVGPSSHAVVEGLRAGRGKLCHGGTLDPFAEGLLLVLAGEATHLFAYLHGVPKVYVAEIGWGTETDTGDAGGAPVATGNAAGLRLPDLTPWIGHHAQVPPATSAKRVDGERAYTRAHRGEDVVLPAVDVYLHAARWLAPDRLELTCAGGFYVRSFVRDLGRAAGVPAHVRRLHRRAIGPWEDPGPGRTTRIQGAALLPWCPSVRRPGGPIEAAPWPLPPGFPAPPVRLLRDGRLHALADADLRVLKELPRGL